jgi:2-keto-3-deoxy-L-arabinonate dehydratase
VAEVIPTTKHSNIIPEFLAGVLPVLPTPFTPNDEVDFAALNRLVDFAAACQVRTVVTPAFGSEFYKLDAAERLKVIETVVARSAMRGLHVVVQCNHATPRVAAKLAAEARHFGASAVATALPRAFAVSTAQLFDYACRVCGATDLPIIIHDWNPNGVAVDAGFFIELHQRCDNFRMAKLEDPGIGGVVRTISGETCGRVGVLSGWAGSYAVQLFEAGLAGLMPGLALADVFVEIWLRLRSGDKAAALALFCEISPYLQFSLQTFEQFHHAEKRLLAAREVLTGAAVRQVTIDLDPDADNYLQLLTERLMITLESKGLTGCRNLA